MAAMVGLTLDQEPFTGSLCISKEADRPARTRLDSIGRPLIQGLLTPMIDRHGSFQGVAVDPMGAEGEGHLFIPAHAITSISRHPVVVGTTVYEAPRRETTTSGSDNTGGAGTLGGQTLGEWVKEKATAAQGQAGESPEEPRKLVIDLAREEVTLLKDVITEQRQLRALLGAYFAAHGSAAASGAVAQSQPAAVGTASEPLTECCFQAISDRQVSVQRGQESIQRGALLYCRQGHAWEYGAEPYPAAAIGWSRLPARDFLPAPDAIAGDAAALNLTAAEREWAVRPPFPRPTYPTRGYATAQAEFCWAEAERAVAGAAERRSEWQARHDAWRRVAAAAETLGKALPLAYEIPEKGGE